MSKSKKRVKKSHKNYTPKKVDHSQQDKRNMLVLGITVATVLLLLFNFGF